MNRKDKIFLFKIILIPSLLGIFSGLVSLMKSYHFIVEKILLICIGWIIGYLMLFFFLWQYKLQGELK